MTIYQTIKALFHPEDPFGKALNDLMIKKDNLMLDKLASLFPNEPIQNVMHLLNTVYQVAQFVEQKVEGDAPKFNEVLEQLKNIIEQHKKAS